MDAARDEWRVKRRRGKPRGLRRAATLFSQVSLAVGTSEVRAGGAAFGGAVIAAGMTHLGSGAHREGGEDTGAPGAGAAGAKREARAARAQADGRGAAAHDEPRCG